MSIEIIVAATGILGVMASTLVQLYLGRQQEARKKIIQIRAQAYLDLVNAFADIVYGGGIKVSDETMGKLIQAKSRSVVLGSDGVVKAIEEFWREHGALDTPEAIASFTFIVARIRKDLTGKLTLSNNLLSNALFNRR